MIQPEEYVQNIYSKYIYSLLKWVCIFWKSFVSGQLLHVSNLLTLNKLKDQQKSLTDFTLFNFTPFYAWVEMMNTHAYTQDLLD